MYIDKCQAVDRDKGGKKKKGKKKGKKVTNYNTCFLYFNALYIYLQKKGKKGKKGKKEKDLTPDR